MTYVLAVLLKIVPESTRQSCGKQKTYFSIKSYPEAWSPFWSEPLYIEAALRFRSSLSYERGFMFIRVVVRREHVSCRVVSLYRGLLQKINWNKTGINITVEVVELWTAFNEHYSLLGQSNNMGRCISTLFRRIFWNTASSTCLIFFSISF